MDKNRAEATAASADVPLSNITAIRSNSAYPLPRLERSLSAPAPRDWTPGIIHAIGSARLTRFFTRLKLSRAIRGDYRSLLQTLMLDTPGKSSISPFDLEEWRKPIVRFDFQNGAECPERITIIRELTNRLIGNPAQLGDFSYSDAMTFHPLWERHLHRARLWQASCAPHGAENRAIYRIPYETSANMAAQSIRPPNLPETGLARANKRARLALGLPDSFDASGATGRVRLLSSSDNTPGEIPRFLSSGAAENVLRQDELSIQSIASGIQ